MPVLHPTNFHFDENLPRGFPCAPKSTVIDNPRSLGSALAVLRYSLGFFFPSPGSFPANPVLSGSRFRWCLLDDPKLPEGWTRKCVQRSTGKLADSGLSTSTGELQRGHLDVNPKVRGSIPRVSHFFGLIDIIDC